MIEDPVVEHLELKEVDFTAADLILGSSESKRAKVSETLLNILEGRIRNRTPGKLTKPPGGHSSNFARSISWSSIG